MVEFNTYILINFLAVWQLNFDFVASSRSEFYTDGWKSPVGNGWDRTLGKVVSAEDFELSWDMKFDYLYDGDFKGWTEPLKRSVTYL